MPKINCLHNCPTIDPVRKKRVILHSGLCARHCLFLKIVSGTGYVPILNLESLSKRTFLKFCFHHFWLEKLWCFKVDSFIDGKICSSKLFIEIMGAVFLTQVYANFRQYTPMISRNILIFFWTERFSNTFS